MDVRPAGEPPDDPFAALGLPRSFALDATAIRKAYLTRSAGVHPDRDPSDPERLQATARLNRARQDLADPELRADVLLRLLGGPSRETERGLPQGFLAEIMDLRERLEQVSSAGDPTEVGRWRNWADELRSARLEEIQRAFAALPAPPPAESLRAIRIELNALRYVERLIESLDGKGAA